MKLFLCEAAGDESGSTLLEFALSAVLLLTLIFGILDCSRALYIDHFVGNAAREATRYAAVRGNDWKGAACATTANFACEATAADVSAFVKSVAPAGVDPSLMTVKTSWPGTDAAGASCTSGGLAADSAGCTVVVQIVYKFSFVLPLLPANKWSLPSTSRVTIEQ